MLVFCGKRGAYGQSRLAGLLKQCDAQRRERTKSSALKWLEKGLHPDPKRRKQAHFVDITGKGSTCGTGRWVAEPTASAAASTTALHIAAVAVEMPGPTDQELFGQPQIGIHGLTALREMFEADEVSLFDESEHDM